MGRDQTHRKEQSKPEDGPGREEGGIALDAWVAAEHVGRRPGRPAEGPRWRSQLGINQPVPRGQHRGGRLGRAGGGGDGAAVLKRTQTPSKPNSYPWSQHMVLPRTTVQEDRWCKRSWRTAEVLLCRQR